MNVIKKLFVWCGLFLIAVLATAVFFMSSAYMASGLSQHTVITDPAQWLQFGGAFFGIILTISGAFLVMQMQIEAAEKEKTKEREAQQKNLQRAILLLLRGEIEINNELFVVHYSGYIDAGVIGITPAIKLAVDEWQNLKYTIIEKLDIAESGQFIESLVSLYYELERINRKVETGTTICFKEKEQMASYLREIKIRFDHVNAWFKDLERVANYS
ncbi:MAG: hypothetical protein ABRQ24_00050 [Syntrophomonadaceae bacterium]